MSEKIEGKVVDINTKEEKISTAEQDVPQETKVDLQSDLKKDSKEDITSQEEPQTTVEEIPEGDHQTSTEELPEEEQPVKKEEKETPVEVYKVGDLNFKCHSCGHSYVIEEGIQGGIRFDLYATSKHKLVMACPNCKAVMEMFFTKGDDSGIVDMDGNLIKGASKSKEKVEEPEMDEVDIKDSEEMPEEVKEEISNEQVKQEITDEEPVQEENK